MASHAHALTVDRVYKTYPARGTFGAKKGAGTPALQDISLHISEGETVGLLGQNGSGKTTLLKIISTLIEPTSGQVLLNGVDTARDLKAARRQMGLVTCDERSFYWRLSGRENLEFFGALYGLTPAEIAGRSTELFDVLDLAYAADRAFQSYSSGMKQKLAIARGLLCNPRLILYDEPTRSLDALSASHIRTWLMENKKRHPGRAHLIATHLLHEAEQLCDRVVIIDRGVLISSGTVAEVRAQYSNAAQTRFEVIYTGTVSRASLRQTCVPGEVLFEQPDEAGATTIRFSAAEHDGTLSAVLQAILAGGGVVEDCRSERPSFDEVFCGLVEGRTQAMKADAAKFAKGVPV